MLKIHRITAYLLFVSCAFFCSVALASDDEVWWESAVQEAERDGYRLINTAELVALLQSDADFTLLDVRADYEFEAGHLPKAENIEFDLGDRMALAPEKRAALEAVTGSERKRRLVIYCRSFR